MPKIWQMEEKHRRVTRKINKNTQGRAEAI